MGLDISFSSEHAVEMGLVVRTETNGTPQEIAIALEEERVEGPGYWETSRREWLQKEVQVIEVPNADHCVQAGEGWSVTPDGTETDIFFVRANHWGNTFAPLTEWLDSHGISWDES